jgi:His/Glu/Gln/Arg/opine family amino acid ABC transporter permease subunit
MQYQPDLGVVVSKLPFILQGLAVTLYVAVLAMAVALVVGLVIALLRISSIAALRVAASAFIQFFRGIPQFVFLLWLYYGIALLFGINFQPITAGVIALSIQYGAYLSEIFRSGIQSVHKGQIEAGLSVGLSRFRIYQRIVLPQAFRVALPPTVNIWISVLKDTALVSVIGVNELMRVTQIQSNYTFRPFEFYTAAALIYVVLTLFFARIATMIETRVKI